MDDEALRRHRARRRQRIEARAYYVAFPVATGVAFAVATNAWLRLLVAVAAGAVTGLAIRALTNGLRRFYR